MISPAIPSLFLAYLKIGCSAFGGGIAALPVFRTELATRRGWLSEASVDELFAASQAIPGVILVNAAVLTALPLRRRAGAVLAALAVVLPAFLVILLLGSFLMVHRDSPVIDAIWLGLRPAVIGLLLATAVRLLRAHARRPLSALIALAATTFLLMHPSPLPALLAAIALPPVLRRLRRRPSKVPSPPPPPPPAS